MAAAPMMQKNILKENLEKNCSIGYILY